MLTRIEALVKGLSIQRQFGGKALEIVLVEGPQVLAGLVVIQLVVISPEQLFALVGGALTGFRRPLRFRPQESEMDVPQTDNTGLNVGFVDLAPRASGESPAERSLEVTKLDNGDRGIWISLEMPGLRDHGFHQGCLAG